MPDIIGIAQPGVVYTGKKSKIAEHGGDTKADRNVPVVVSGPGATAGRSVDRRVTQALIPIMTDDETRRLLAVCHGNGFAQVRDQAMIRMFCSTGARLAEIGDPCVDDVDLDTESVWLHGKGGKDRRARFGPVTARAVSRYIRVRGRRDGASEIAQLWLSVRGLRPLQPAAIKVGLR